MNKNDKNPNPLQGQNIQQETEIKLLRGLLDRVSTHATGLEEELGTVKKHINKYRDSSEKWEHETRQLRLTLDNLYSSRSWKLTLPVRMFSRLIRWIFRLPSRALRRLGQQIRAFGTDNRQYMDNNPPKPNRYRGQASSQSESTQLSPRETEIYNELLHIINKKKNGN